MVIPEYLRNLKIVGENRDKTIISYNDHARLNNMGTFRTYTLMIRGSNIILENLTIENNAPMVAQAVALHTEGDRIILKNCRLLGNQDTLYTGREKGRLFFHNCYIEGTTDFIFGPSTAWFEACTLHGKRTLHYRGQYPSGCRIWIHLQPVSHHRCRECNLPLPGPSLAPLRNDALHALHTSGGYQPFRVGQLAQPDNEQTARYAEFNNSGKGSRPAERVAWSKILTQGEGASITLEKVMGDFYPAIIAETNHLEP